MTTEMKSQTCVCGNTFVVPADTPSSDVESAQRLCPECSEIVKDENVLSQLGVPLPEEEDLTRDVEGEREDDEFGTRDQENEEGFKDEREAEDDEDDDADVDPFDDWEEDDEDVEEDEDEDEDEDEY